MSQENVELVRRLQPAPDVDVAALFRDERAATVMAEAVAPLFHLDFECVTNLPTEGRKTYVGLDGLRAAWLDWLAPWATYRTEIEDCIDAGERVVVLVRDFGRRDLSAPEIEVVGAAVWTASDGKLARAEFYTRRAEALEAVGLRE